MLEKTLKEKVERAREALSRKEEQAPTKEKDLTIPQERAIVKTWRNKMVRDYKERTGLRSSDGETINIGDVLSQEGAYVCVPVETLDVVKGHIAIAENTEFLDDEGREDVRQYFLFVLCLIKNELFPEEGGTTKQEGGK